MAVGVDVPVLIVGGGPVGLCASLALTRFGVPSLLVERHPGTAPNPKALHLSTRTMEVLRYWGAADAVREQALPRTDHALFLGSSMADPDFVRHPIWPDDPEVSAERSTLVSQEVLEPVLRRIAETTGARTGHPGAVRFHTRLTHLVPDPDGVIAELVGPHGPTTVRARWVLGADGAASTVRRAARIDFPGDDVHDSVNILFSADLSSVVADRRSAFYFVQNDTVRGLLPVVDNARAWRLHVVLAPGETAADYRDASRRLALVRAAVGVPDLDVALGEVYGWGADARVASAYRSGRLLLAGDAAHVCPPSGGLGLNVGVQDVHNLTWKIADVEHGEARPELLDTYEQERRPVALRTVAEAVLNHEFESAPVRTDDDRLRKHERRRQAGLVLGQHYERGAFVPDGSPLPAVADAYVEFEPVARPGHRAPHLWVEFDGGRTTMLDALHTDYCTLLVAGGSAAAAARWRAAAGEDVAVRTVGSAPADVITADRPFQRMYGLSPGGAALVRPDGIVAMRTPEPPSPEAARAALDAAGTALRRRSVSVGAGPAERTGP